MKQSTWDVKAYLANLARHGDRTCFIHEEGRITSYRQLLDAVEWNAAALRKAGCASQGTDSTHASVAFDVWLGWRAVPLLLAIFLEGLTAVPVDPVRSPAQCRRILGSVRPALYLRDKQLDEQGKLRLSASSHCGNKHGYYDLQHADSKLAAGIAMLLFTSGTGGQPKGVLLSYRNIGGNLAGVLDYFRLGPEDRLIMVRSLAHASAITGELLPALYHGSSILLRAHERGPLAIVRSVQEHAGTILCTTPSVAAALAGRASRYDTNTLQRIVLSGELLLPAHVDRIRRGFPEATLSNAYGLTEASPRVSCQLDIAQSDSLACVGKPITGVQIRIDPPENDVTAASMGANTGVLWVSGPGVMAGYLDDKEATDIRLRDGWLCTQDLASWQDGELHVYGRADDMLIRSGMNVHPAEVESWLTGIEGILEAMVFGTSTPQGTRIVAWVVAEPGMEAKEIYRLLLRGERDERLWPDELELKSELPKTPSGKIRRPARPFIQEREV